MSTTRPTPARSALNDNGSNPAPKPTRRRFTAEYKLAILNEIDAAPEEERGAIMRRENLYYSHLIDWRAARDGGALRALTDARTSERRPRRSPEAIELDRVKTRNTRLEDEVTRLRTALEAMGKVQALLAMISESAEPQHK
jgi:transposase